VHVDQLRHKSVAAFSKHSVLRAECANFPRAFAGAFPFEGPLCAVLFLAPAGLFSFCRSVFLGRAVFFQGICNALKARQKQCESYHIWSLLLPLGWVLGKR